MLEKGLLSVIVPVINEQKQISTLVRSCFAQSYRPVELVLVDGGSTDKTLDILGQLKRELETDSFAILIDKEAEHSQVISAADARNLGIKLSRGEFLIIVDSDVVFLDKAILGDVVKQLKTTTAAGMKFIALNTTWLEYHTAVDDHCYEDDTTYSRVVAYRKSVIVEMPFDPELGFGDDAGILMRVPLPDKAPVVPGRCGKHHMQTFGEWRSQSLWYGRTVVRRARRIRGDRFLPLKMSAGVILLGLSAAVLAFGQPLGLIPLVVWGGAVVWNDAKSPRRDRWRIAYQALRASYASFWVLIGILTTVVWGYERGGRKVYGRGK